MQEFIENEITTDENEPKVSYFWKGLALFLLGVIVGILFAPIKKGVNIGNNNNIVADNDEDNDDCDDDFYSEDGIKF